MSELKGYRGVVREALIKAGAEVGDEVIVESRGRVFKGILMPRSELADENHIVIKLDNGYNVGLRFRKDTRITVLVKGKVQLFERPVEKVEARRGLPKVMILGTGGTIASRVDYKTGAVRAVYSPDELVEIFPELLEIAEIETKIIMNKYSEHLRIEDWIKMAKEVEKCISAGYDGVVIMHGTDLMGYTAAALSFSLQNLPIPVILVGSQRSSDRPSSDAALNLISAVKAAATAPIAEVMVAMHENTEDKSVVLHRGTRVRKNHTSRRDAFETIGAKPYARVINGKTIQILSNDYRVRDRARRVEVKAKFDRRAALLKFHPEFNPKIIDFLVDEGYRGIVLEGTGLGHIGEYVFKSIENAISRGTLIFITSQCIWGRLNLNVYDTGRLLLEMGVIPLEDMIPETAIVKLMWCLGQTSDKAKVLKLMLKNIAGEYTDISLPKEVIHAELS